MTTRSGKRIHSSFHDNTNQIETEIEVRSDRKTRSNRIKENINQLNITLFEPKKLINYVSYPTDDENLEDTGNVSNSKVRNITKPRNIALKEQQHNILEQDLQTSNTASKQIRFTRRTEKIAEDVANPTCDYENKQESIPVEKTKKKKNKKGVDMEKSYNLMEPVLTRKKSKRKKGIVSNSLLAEVVIHQEDLSNNSLINSDGNAPEIKTKVTEQVKKKNSKSKGKISVCDNILLDGTNALCKENDVSSSLKNLGSLKNLESSPKDKLQLKEQISDNETPHSYETRRSSIINSTYEKGIIDKTLDDSDTASNNKEFATDCLLDKNDTTIKMIGNRSTDDEHSCTPDIPIIENYSTINNSALDNNSKQSADTPELLKRKKSSLQNILFDKNNINITHSISPKFNTTYDRNSTSSTKMNLTFEIDSKISTYDSSSPDQESNVFTTIEKAKVTSKTPEPKKKMIGIITQSSQKDNKRNSMFNNSTISNSKLKSEDNKECVRTEGITPKKTKSLDSTFDKESKINTTFEKGSKLSLVTSDGSNTKDLSQISITSNDSSIDPDVNTLSIDGSSNQGIIMNTTPVLIESSFDETLRNTNKTPVKEVYATPMKREGTFTKASPTFLPKSPAVQSCKVTPSKRKSLPSPGNTPFPVKSSQKEKFPLNVMRSIEKSRRSSLAEPVSRSTRVMFCSPVDDPVKTNLQKRKVIKSNLKGSKKSFIFEDNGTLARSLPRKRSFTQNDADDTYAKKKRLGDELQQSVERLSRPRTSSAIVKSSEPASSSMVTTLLKLKPEGKVSRVRLPNFAALHQKQFDRMESLDECQQRRAKRAKQLLTPTGVAPDRKSPTEPQRDVEKPTKDAKKPNLTIKPIGDHLKPGYTRFGFKINMDMNPFSITSGKEAPKTENLKPNSIKRQLTFPSLSGATTSRREIAKQSVMREKSFTDKRSVKRHENRTIIKGVRTNRRFELQMKLRNIE